MDHQTYWHVALKQRDTDTFGLQYGGNLLASQAQYCVVTLPSSLALLIQTQCTLHKEQSLAALFSARQAATADRYLPTPALHLSNGSPVTVLRSPAHYTYYHFKGSWLIYQKVKFRFLLDNSMFRAYFCLTKLQYEALKIKKSWKRRVVKFRDGSVTDEITFYFSPTQNHPVSYTVCPPYTISKHAPSIQHWSIQCLQYISNGAADSVQYTR